MSTLIAITLIVSAVSLVSAVIGIVIGRGITMADEREPGPDIVPFEDDFPTVEMPAVPPVPAPSQHFTDAAWDEWLLEQPADSLTEDLLALRLRYIERAEGWAS